MQEETVVGMETLNSAAARSIIRPPAERPDRRRTRPEAGGAT